MDNRMDVHCDTHLMNNELRNLVSDQEFGFTDGVVTGSVVFNDNP